MHKEVNENSCPIHPGFRKLEGSACFKIKHTIFKHALSRRCQDGNADTVQDNLRCAFSPLYRREHGTISVPQRKNVRSSISSEAAKLGACCFATASTHMHMPTCLRTSSDYQCRHIVQDPTVCVALSYRSNRRELLF